MSTRQKTIDFLLKRYNTISEAKKNGTISWVAIKEEFHQETGFNLNKDYFRANSDGLAKDSNDFYIYETDTGKLFYDADGNGSGKSKQIALIENKASLTYADFVVL